MRGRGLIKAVGAGCLALLGILMGCGGGGSLVGSGPGLGSGSNNALLKGQYAFAFSGQGTGGSVFDAVGSFTADGAGHLTGSEDVNGTSTTVSFSGPYSLGSDGRGNVVLGIQPGCPNWQFTMVSQSHGLLTCLNSNITASGTIDLQDPTAFSAARLKGNYVFNFSGLGAAGSLAVMAGDWSLDGSGNISRGEMDVNDLAALATPLQDIPVTGTYSVNPNGRGIATINSSYGTQNFVFYVVNSKDLKFIETDTQPIVSGEVLSQAPGPFTIATLNGAHALTLGGTDGSNNPFALGGVFTTDGAGNVTSGALDANDSGNTFLGTSVTGTYTMNSTGRGILRLTSQSLQFAFYAAANGSIQLVDVDGSVGISGTAQAQTGGPFAAGSISGNYAFNFSGTNLSSFGEEDITGQLIADGAGNLTGTMDVNNLGSITHNIAISSSSYTMGGDGRGTATINTLAASFAMQIYQVDKNTVLFLDVDNSRVLAGVMQKQQF